MKRLVFLLILGALSNQTMARPSAETMVLTGNCIVGMSLIFLAENEHLLPPSSRVDLAVGIIDGINQMFPRDNFGPPPMPIESPAMDAMRRMIFFDLPYYEKHFIKEISDYLLRKGVITTPSTNYEESLQGLRLLAYKIRQGDFLNLSAPSVLYAELSRLLDMSDTLYAGQCYISRYAGALELDSPYYQVGTILRGLTDALKNRLGHS